MVFGYTPAPPDIATRGGMASSDTVAGDRDGALTEGVVSKTDEAEHQELSLRPAAGGSLSRV